jgi:hypothetical protein
MKKWTRGRRRLKWHAAALLGHGGTGTGSSRTNRPCRRAQGTNVKAVGVGMPGGEGRKLLTRGKRDAREEDAERGLKNGVRVPTFAQKSVFFLYRFVPRPDLARFCRPPFCFRLKAARGVRQGLRTRDKVSN